MFESNPLTSRILLRRLAVSPGFWYMCFVLGALTLHRLKPWRVKTQVQTLLIDLCMHGSLMVLRVHTNINGDCCFICFNIWTYSPVTKSTFPFSKQNQTRLWTWNTLFLGCTCFIQLSYRFVQTLDWKFRNLQLENGRTGRYEYIYIYIYRERERSRERDM